MSLFKNPSARTLLLLAACLSGAALLSALISQYMFGLYPCHLCILQRYPHGILLALTALLLLVRRPGWQEKGVWICVLLFLAAAGIGLYHAGVEKGWLEGPGSCTTSASGTQTIEELRQQIRDAPITFCDEPAFEFFGLTMASLHALYCLGAAALLSLLLKRGKNEPAGIA